MSTKQSPCRYVIFSQNCCFVTNFVDDSTCVQTKFLIHEYVAKLITNYFI